MFRSRITDIMTCQDKYPFFSLATLLLGISGLYSGMVRLRQRLYARRALASLGLPCPVISVGNLTVGGTGKTPLVIHLAELINMLGYRPTILSRGYKGLSEKGGTVVSDGHSLLCDARQGGDEPYLMATLLPTVPVVVGRDRYAAGMDAIKRFKPDVILLDDGYQHLRLRRDLNLLLLDAQNPFGNTHLLPRGTLREPAASLARADAVVLTRSQRICAESYSQFLHLIQPRPLFASTHQSVARMDLEAGQPIESLQRQNLASVDLKGKRVFAFAGLGRNDSFFDTIVHMGACLQGTMGFDDHHPYSSCDLDRIVRLAHQSGANCLVTTDKDFVRLPQCARVPLELIVMGVAMDFGVEQGKWRDYIGRKIQGLIER